MGKLYISVQILLVTRISQAQQIELELKQFNELSIKWQLFLIMNELFKSCLLTHFDKIPNEVTNQKNKQQINQSKIVTDCYLQP